MINALEYRIMLQLALGPGRRADDIIDYFGSPEEVFLAGRSERLISGVLTSKLCDAIDRVKQEDADAVIAECGRNSWSILTCGDAGYPESLRRISGYPLVLYIKGDASVLTRTPMISMVGTRNVSAYGARVASDLSYELASAGFTVVSGGAVGVDSICHRGALDAGGTTVAFLGCGLGYPYLMSNGELRERIAASGAVVSEYPPGTPASKSTFPIRNRLISGISCGTVVIEAGAKSGSLITARTAAEQGKDVFAVPGDITDREYSGTNSLIRDGAYPVFSADDIINVYASEHPELAAAMKKRKAAGGAKRDPGLARKEAAGASRRLRGSKKTDKSEPFAASVKTEAGSGADCAGRPAPEAPEGASPEARLVWSALGSEPADLDEVALKCGLGIQKVLSAVTELELSGAAVMHPGKRYSLP